MRAISVSNLFAIVYAVQPSTEGRHSAIVRADNSSFMDAGDAILELDKPYRKLKFWDGSTATVWEDTNDICKEISAAKKDCTECTRNGGKYCVVLWKTHRPFKLPASHNDHYQPKPSNVKKYTEVIPRYSCKCMQAGSGKLGWLGLKLGIKNTRATCFEQSYGQPGGSAHYPHARESITFDDFCERIRSCLFDPGGRVRSMLGCSEAEFCH